VDSGAASQTEHEVGPPELEAGGDGAADQMGRAESSIWPGVIKRATITTLLRPAVWECPGGPSTPRCPVPGKRGHRELQSDHAVGNQGAAKRASGHRDDPEQLEKQCTNKIRARPQSRATGLIVNAYASSPSAKML
jgi:hypothetical protein